MILHDLDDLGMIWHDLGTSLGSCLTKMLETRSIKLIRPSMMNFLIIGPPRIRGKPHSELEEWRRKAA